MLCCLAQAAEAPILYQGADGSVPPSFQAWHPQFEDNGSYGESWFYVVQAHDGGALFVLLSVTNLGLRTFDGSVDLQYYAPDGRRFGAHQEVHRDQIAGSSQRADMRIGGAHARGGEGSWQLTVQEGEVQLDLSLDQALPSFRFGDGKVRFADGAEYTVGINTPRAQSSGSISFGQERFDLRGLGYHDHGWATKKLPSFMHTWYALRLQGERYSLVLHRQLFEQDHGAVENRFGLLAGDGRVLAASRDFQLDVTRSRTVGSYQLPAELAIDFDAQGYQVRGSCAEQRFLEDIDVLAAISLPVRLAIKAFYSDPHLLRAGMRCRLEVTQGGETELLEGEALVETDYY